VHDAVDPIAAWSCAIEDGSRCCGWWRAPDDCWLPRCAGRRERCVLRDATQGCAIGGNCPVLAGGRALGGAVGQPWNQTLCLSGSAWPAGVLRWAGPLCVNGADRPCSINPQAASGGPDGVAPRVRARLVSVPLPRSTAQTLLRGAWRHDSGSWGAGQRALTCVTIAQDTHQPGWSARCRSLLFVGSWCMSRGVVEMRAARVGQRSLRCGARQARPRCPLSLSQPGTPTSGIPTTQVCEPV